MVVLNVQRTSEVRRTFTILCVALSLFWDAPFPGGCVSILDKLLLWLQGIEFGAKGSFVACLPAQDR